MIRSPPGPNHFLLIQLFRPDRLLAMFQLADLALAPIIDNKLIHRPAVLAGYHNLVALGVVLVGIHPVSFRDHQRFLMALVARKLQLPILAKTVPGLADHSVAVLAVNIVKVIVEHRDYFLSI